MSKLNLAEVERLLLDQSAEEIRQQELDPEAAAFLEEWEDFAGNLQELPKNLASLTVDAPAVPYSAQLKKTPRHQRVPGWWTALAAAASFLLAWVLFQTPTPAPDPEKDLHQILNLQRSGSIDTARNEADKQLVTALLTHALMLFDRDTPDDYAEALIDLQRAFALAPDHERVLTYLVLTCEALGEKQLAQAYQKRLEGLSNQ